MLYKKLTKTATQIIALCLITFSIANIANAEEYTMHFKVLKNDVNDYGEESIQMETNDGNLAIYAVNLSNEILDVLLAARAGNCMAITSPSPIEAYSGFYSIDQVDNALIYPCPSAKPQELSTGCVLENNKVLVLSNLNTNPTYTYGKAGKPEIELSEDGNTKVYKGTQMFSGGGSTYMRFTNGNISYVAYNGTGRGWDYVGVIVYKNDKQIFYSKCKTADLLYGISTDDINAPYDKEGYFVGTPN